MRTSYKFIRDAGLHILNYLITNALPNYRILKVSLSSETYFHFLYSLLCSLLHSLTKFLVNDCGLLRLQKKKAVN